MDIQELILIAREKQASDIHLTSGRNPVFRIDGILVESDYVFTYDEKKQLIISMLDDKQRGQMERGEDVDLSYSLENGLRHRVNVFHQQKLLIDVGSFAGALRSAMREDPDVILVGEMRDYETIDRIIDIFPRIISSRSGRSLLAY